MITNTTKKIIEKNRASLALLHGFRDKKWKRVDIREIESDLYSQCCAMRAALGGYFIDGCAEERNMVGIIKELVPTQWGRDFILDEPTNFVEYYDVIARALVESYDDGYADVVNFFVRCSERALAKKTFALLRDEEIVIARICKVNPSLIWVIPSMFVGSYMRGSPILTKSLAKIRACHFIRTLAYQVSTQEDSPNILVLSNMIQARVVALLFTFARYGRITGKRSSVALIDRHILREICQYITTSQY